MLNNLLLMHLKLIQKNQFKTVKATGGSIWDKIANVAAKSHDDKITGCLSAVPSKIQDVEFEKPIEILRKRYTSTEKRQQIIDELRLI